MKIPAANFNKTVTQGTYANCYKLAITGHGVMDTFADNLSPVPHHKPEADPARTAASPGIDDGTWNEAESFGQKLMLIRQSLGLNRKEFEQGIGINACGGYEANGTAPAPKILNSLLEKIDSYIQRHNSDLLSPSQWNEFRQSAIQLSQQREEERHRRGIETQRNKLKNPRRAEPKPILALSEAQIPMVEESQRRYSRLAGNGLAMLRQAEAFSYGPERILPDLNHQLEKLGAPHIQPRDFAEIGPKSEHLPPAVVLAIEQLCDNVFITRDPIQPRNPANLWRDVKDKVAGTQSGARHGGSFGELYAAQARLLAEAKAVAAEAPSAAPPNPSHAAEIMERRAEQAKGSQR